MRGFMVRVTGLGESGKNKTGEGLVWGTSMTEYTRKHSRHEKTSVPSDRVAHTNPTAKEAVRNCVGIMTPLKCPSLFLVIVMFTQEKNGHGGRNGCQAGAKRRGCPPGPS